MNATARQTVRDFYFEEVILRYQVRIAGEREELELRDDEVDHLCRVFLSEVLPRGTPALPEKMARKAKAAYIEELRTEVQGLIKREMERVAKYWATVDPDKTRRERKILPEVWDRRPYMRWPHPLTKDDSKVYLPDIGAVTGAYWSLNAHQRSYMERLARQSHGWSITRHHVPGYKKHVYAEIRPDASVVTGPPTRHVHAVKGEEPEELKANTGVRVLIKGSKAWEQHCRRVDALNEKNGIDAPPHATLGPTEVHEHPDEAKYVFPPSEKKDVAWEHDHTSENTKAYYDEWEEDYANHIAKWHKDNSDMVEYRHGGLHVHNRRVKDYSNSLAKRLDIHPMALDRLPEAEVVYFAIEGCLKADAILSEIIRKGRKASVFSVPSVSLWDAKELTYFAKEHLKGKTVIIVPDADWVDNDLVIAQARLAERYLVNVCGLKAYVAAPPLTKAGKVEHKGVDDFLAAGHTLDELVVMEREESPMLATAIAMKAEMKVGGRKQRSEGLQNKKILMRKLAHLATREGYVKATHEQLAKVMGVARSTVTGHVNDLKEWEWITVEKKVEDIWTPVEGTVSTKKGYVTRRGLYIRGPEEWRDTARIKVHDELRGVDLDPWPLSELRERLKLREPTAVETEVKEPPTKAETPPVTEAAVTETSEEITARRVRLNPMVKVRRG